MMMTRSPRMPQTAVRATAPLVTVVMAVERLRRAAMRLTGVV